MPDCRLRLNYIRYTLSAAEHENTCVALKTILEGSIEPPPGNVILYVTFNHRHLQAEHMKDEWR
jgi:predicted AAA+ superfamily ATPase